MAEACPRKYASSGKGECTICREEVPFLDVLPCNHALCSTCIETITNGSCPHCRKTFQSSTKFPKVYFAQLECFSCLKMKESEEFSWCNQCSVLICFRCRAKEADRHQEHRFFDWDNEAPAGIYLEKVLSREMPGENVLRKKITQLLSPVVNDLVEKVYQRRKNLEDIAKEFGVPLETKGNEEIREPENLLKIISKVRGADILPSDLFLHPDEIVNHEEISDAIFRNLKFTSELCSPIRDAKVQTDIRNDSGESYACRKISGSTFELSSLPGRFSVVFGEMCSVGILTENEIQIFTFSEDSSKLQHYRTFQPSKTKNSFVHASIYDKDFLLHMLNSTKDNFWLTTLDFLGRTAEWEVNRVPFNSTQDYIVKTSKFQDGYLGSSLNGKLFAIINTAAESGECIAYLYGFALDTKKVPKTANLLYFCRAVSFTAVCVSPNEKTVVVGGAKGCWLFTISPKFQLWAKIPLDYAPTIGVSMCFSSAKDYIVNVNGKKSIVRLCVNDYTMSVEKTTENVIAVGAQNGILIKSSMSQSGLRIENFPK